MTLIPLANEARTAELRIILSSKLLPTSPVQASAVALDTALELFSPIPTGICEFTFTLIRLFFLISFGMISSIIFSSKLVPSSG